MCGGRGRFEKLSSVRRGLTQSAAEAIITYLNLMESEIENQMQGVKSLIQRLKSHMLTFNALQ